MTDVSVGCGKCGLTDQQITDYKWVKNVIYEQYKIRLANGNTYGTAMARLSGTAHITTIIFTILHSSL